MLKKVLLYPLCTLLALLLMWLLWSAFAYRDIPVTTLEEHFGGAGLLRADIDGVSVAYKDEGAGPVLLLIHSHYFSMRMWDEWVEPLARDFRVIRFDMTSHGLTGPEPGGDYSMARDLALIEGLLESLGVDRFHVAGSSLGGNMAFHLAARFPGRVQRLALINSGGIPREGSRGTSGTIPVWVDYVSYFVPTMAFQAFLRWMIVDDALVSDELAAEFHEMFRGAGNRFAEFDRLRAFRVGDPAPLLAAITAPTLLMWGADNPQLPVTQVEKFEAALTTASSVERIIYPGVGHVIPLEIPGQGAADLGRFLLGLRL